MLKLVWRWVSSFWRPRRGFSGMLVTDLLIVVVSDDGQMVEFNGERFEAVAGISKRHGE